MDIHNFEKTSKGIIRESVNGNYKQSFIGAVLIELGLDDSFYIIDSSGFRHLYETHNKIIQLNGVEINDTAENICKALDEVFLKSNSSSAGSGVSDSSNIYTNNSRLSYGLVCHWDMSESEGIRMDSISNVGLSPVNNPTVIPSRFGNAASFIGSLNQYLGGSGNNILSVASTGFTIAVLVKIIPNGTYSIILGKSKEYNLYYAYTNNLIIFQTSNNGAGLQHSVGAPYIPDGDYCLIVAYSNGVNQIGISVNNAPFITSAITGTYKGTGNFFLGWDGDSGTTNFRLNGSIDKVGFWSRPFIQADVNQLYVATLPPIMSFRYFSFHATTEMLLVHGGAVMSAMNPIPFNYNLLDGTKAQRDPNILRDGNNKALLVNGYYWMVHTYNPYGVFYQNMPGIGLAKSKDLSNWEFVKSITVGTSSTSSWAPKWFYDGGKYYVLFSQSIAAGDTGFQPYYFEFTTLSDTPVISAIASITGSVFPNNMIDINITKVGSVYYAWYKNENTKYLTYSSSTSPFSGYNTGGADITALGGGLPYGIEGSQLLLIGGVWYILYDKQYGSVNGMHYRTSSDNWITWSAETKLTNNYLLRHGCMVLE